MAWEHLKLLVDAAKQRNPAWFGLETDPPASEEEISTAETVLGARFPPSYRRFLAEYGGGYFAFANVFSVRADSEWSVVERNRALAVSGFVAISDNEAGDVYGFEVVDGRCRPQIVLREHDEEGALKATPFADLTEFLAKVALKSP